MSTIETPSTLVVYHTRKATWHSCNSIREGLVASYVHLLGRSKNWQIKISKKNQTIKQNCKRLIFLESLPHPLFTLLHNPHLLKNTQEFVFHVTGEFSFYTPEWLRLFEHLQGKKVLLLTACRAQRDLVRSFLKPASRPDVQVLPFSIDLTRDSNKEDSMTKSDSQQDCLALRKGLRKDLRKGLGQPLRKLLRQPLGIPADAFLVTYAGRFSIEKNMIDLVELLQKFDHKKVHLALVGSTDDFDYNVKDGSLESGEFYFMWQKFLSGLAKSFRKKIHILPRMDRSELLGLFSASDLYCSLSTFHGEDFGVAPLEALMVGCPALLSNWGGFREFSAGPFGASLVDVVQAGPNTKFVERSFFSHLARFISSPESLTQRRARAAYFQNRFSAEAIARRLDLLLQEERTPFLGANKFMTEHSNLNYRYRRFEGALFDSYSLGNPNYFKLYHGFYGR